VAERPVALPPATIRGKLVTGTVVSLFKNAAFDPETTQVMGQAYERACLVLQSSDQPEIVKEVIAKRIVEVTQSGERDPEKLCVRALKALGIER
jgi:hypothetical protein